MRSNEKPCQAHSIGLQSIYIILLGFERIKDCFFCFLLIWRSLALKTRRASSRGEEVPAPGHSSAAPVPGLATRIDPPPPPATPDVGTSSLSHVKQESTDF